MISNSLKLDIVIQIPTKYMMADISYEILQFQCLNLKGLYEIFL